MQSANWLRPDGTLTRVKALQMNVGPDNVVRHLCVVIDESIRWIPENDLRDLYWHSKSWIGKADRKDFYALSHDEQMRVLTRIANDRIKSREKSIKMRKDKAKSKSRPVKDPETKELEKLVKGLNSDQLKLIMSKLK